MKKAVNKLIMRPLWVACTIMTLWGCSGDDPKMPKASTEWRKVKVAVIMETDEQTRWERTAAWALANIREAQSGMEHGVELELTFKSSDDADIADYMRSVAADDETVAVIGPTNTPAASQFAAIFDETGVVKPMITTTATGIEYQRRYASRPYVWNMAESDVAQIEVLVSEIASRQVYASGSVTLLTVDSEDENRSAFAEWFAFIAEEYGLKIEGVELYKSEADVRAFARCLCGTDYRLSDRSLIFNPSSPDIAVAFDDEIGRMKADVFPGTLYTPLIMCSDAAVSDDIAVHCVNAAYEGVDMYASPESGFHIAYRIRFGEDLVNGEAQLYDALCLVAYAATLSGQTGKNVNDAILSVVDGDDGKGGSWMPADMARNFTALAKGVTPDIDGVSGPLTFDAKTHSTVAGSTFRRWRLCDNRYVTIQYVSTAGSKRTSSSTNFWEWTAAQMQKFDPDENNGLTYPALDERWALLVAGSTGWTNYRFQADVFAMYDILRRHGYDDGHIVLIAEDDVANHPRNPYPGTLCVSEDSDNLYRPEAIDYRLSDINPEDIADILQGKRSERLPEVIGADEDDNVFIFWSSHGNMGSLDFGNQRHMSHIALRDYIAAASHRKLFMAVEACYSGGIGEVCAGIPGTLFITAARSYETSHADVWSETAGVYLSNGFTRGFLDAVMADPHTTLRDLLYTLTRSTAGSHVTLYNDDCYGSVYNNTMKDYLE